MFWIFKLIFDEDILSYFDLATGWATFFNIWPIFNKLLVTLLVI
jgi:hypothetical protein